MGLQRGFIIALLCLFTASCSTEGLTSEASGEGEYSPDTADQSLVLSTQPSFVPIARIEGYGNPKTGELWMRAVPAPAFEWSDTIGGVGVQRHALGGHCSVTIESDGVPNSNPLGTFEFYNEYDASGQSSDESSFDPAICDGRLDPVFGSKLGVFESYGVGCAHQHIGNFSGEDYEHVYLDIDVFSGDEALHGPYLGSGNTNGTLDTPAGRNAPQSLKGLWDYGAMADGETKNLWVYFKNGDTNDFTWNGYILVEGKELCGNDVDEDCDGETDNGCGSALIDDPCYYETDCESGNCEGEVIVSGMGEGGETLADDTPGSCGPPFPFCGPVVLDNTFHVNGLVNYGSPGSTNDSKANVIARQTDGKLILGGQYYREAPIGRSMSLLRVDSYGNLDTSFSSDGHAAPIFDLPSNINGLEIQSDGKIVIGGVKEGNLFVGRMETDGTFDTGFSGDGWDVQTGLNLHSFARDHIAIQLDGKILVAGYSSTEFALLRYNTNGSLDYNFGNSGKATADVSGGQDVVTTILLQPDGKIVVAGFTSTDFALARFDASGGLDTGFGTEGVVVTDIGTTKDEIYGLAYDEGDIIAVGCAQCTFSVTTDSEWALARYDSTGTLDRTFGVGGITLEDIPTDLDETANPTYLSDGAYAVAVLPAGHLMVFGRYKSNTGAPGWLTARYLSDGSRDPCYDDDGWYVQPEWDVLGKNGQARDFVVQPDDSILVAGTVSPSTEGMAIMKIAP